MMTRPLPEIIAHLRAVSANPAVSTTLIQTEDVEALCDAAERPFNEAAVARALYDAENDAPVSEWDKEPERVRADYERLASVARKAAEIT